MGGGTKRRNYRTKMERKVLFIPPPHSISPSPPHQNSSSGVLFQKRIKYVIPRASLPPIKLNFQIPGPPVINISCALALVPALCTTCSELSVLCFFSRGGGGIRVRSPSCRDIAAPSRIYSI
ncbi:hypothetical protein CEXT_309511 [Caerostris extrusa]|uniref:Uncharacterized protein n=1 Tax=Caerostris extrusa TaxID=172846 RepID=A0AAV4RDR4_CAEEX|nr:hypothetical protein CEXT_309511 [Caerostris extrusa]